MRNISLIIFLQVLGFSSADCLGEQIYSGRTDLIWPRILLPQIQLALKPGQEHDVKAGAGWNIHTPGQERQTYVLFEDRAVQNAEVGDKETTINSDSLVQSTFYFEEISTYEMEKKRSAAFVSVGYGSVSGDAGLSRLQKTVEDNHIIYATLEYRGTGEALSSRPTWKQEPEVWEDENINERWARFMDRYGTHYCHSVTYGVRVTIRASVNKKESLSRRDFFAAVKGTVGAWKAGASVANSQETTLKNSNAQFEMAIIGGDSGFAGSTLTGIDQVKTYFEKLNHGKVQLKTGPISVDLRYLKPTFSIAHKKVVDNLYDVPHSEAINEPSPFGIPAGTVVAWYPNERNIQRNTEGKIVRVLAPDGWAFCNSEATIDLTNRFVRGINDATLLGQVGGNNSQTLQISGTTATTIQNGGWMAQSSNTSDPKIKSHSHTFETSITYESVPEYVGLYYIVRLSTDSDE